MNRTGAVLVTGDSGFIGPHLVKRLAREGCDVTGSSALGIDLRDAAAVDRLFNDRQFSEVFHLAACGTPSGAGNPAEVVEVNTGAAVNVARAASRHGVSRFLYMGSGFEYSSRQQPLDESTPLQPENLYGASKAAASTLLQYYFRTEGLPLVTLRPFSVYGPGANPPRLIPFVCSQSLCGLPMKLTAGAQIRDFLFVDDLIDAVLAARDRAPAGAVYNLGGGEENAFPLRTVVETIVTMARQPLTLCQFGAIAPARPEPAYLVANINRAFEELDWRPLTSLRDGLAQTLDWSASRLNLPDPATKPRRQQHRAGETVAA